MSDRYVPQSWSAMGDLQPSWKAGNLFGISLELLWHQGAAATFQQAHNEGHKMCVKHSWASVIP